MTTLQPWLRPDGSRIRGSDIDDPLLLGILSLEDAEQPTRLVVVNLMHWLVRSMHVGHPAPVVEDMARRMRHPTIGDLVIDTGLAYRRRPSPSDVDWYRGVGLLVAHRTQEWDSTDEQWAQQVAADPGLADQRTKEEAWYLHYGPAPEDVCRWTNADMIVVPWHKQSLTGLRDV